MEKPIVIPSTLTAPEFGKINVWNKGTELEVQFTILMEPQGREAEGWRTGLALDASSSMKDAFGRGLIGKVPPELLAEYERKGWVELRAAEDGRPLRVFQEQAYQDAINKGVLVFTPNTVQPVARDFMGFLAGHLDAQGHTTLIYWACGDGSQIEVAGDFDEAHCATADIVGPRTTTFGKRTLLLPALNYFIERFRDARRGMYVFVTDGKIDDFAEVTRYTIQLAQAIASGRRNPVKGVLIGVGDQIDLQQMENLDHLDTGTDVDIWDCKTAKEMRSLKEIFAEVVDEQAVIASSAAIYDSAGKLVKKYTDGLPGRDTIVLAPDCKWFELEVLGRRIRQTVVV
ncbi:MAG: VWA domain-containing protein [Candidatus Competibacteraceae bacterium]